MQNSGTIYRLVYTHQNWNEIRDKLQEVAKGNLGLTQLVGVLKKFLKITNRELHHSNSFNVLQEMKLGNFKSVLSLFGAVASFILKHEQAPPSIPVVQPHTIKEYKLTKREIVLLMCLMTMCLTLRPTYVHPTQVNNFSVFFDSQKHKAQAVISYLDIVLGKEFNPEEPLAIKRNCEVGNIDSYFLLECDKKLGEFELLENGTSIEDFNGKVKIDFANEYLGGGALEYGCVQEEIMFMCHPELLAAIMICPKMEDDEAIGLLGFRKYFKVRGYKSSAEFDGPENCKYNTREDGILEEYIVAMDATYRKNLQFKEQMILREIRKAHAGFTCYPKVNEIVSGNWGCGAFGGNLHAKLLIQWIVATLVGKKLLYCPFNHKDLLEPTYQAAKHLSVGEAYDILYSYERTLLEQEGKKDKSGYTFLKHFLKSVEKYNNKK